MSRANRCAPDTNPSRNNPDTAARAAHRAVNTAASANNTAASAVEVDGRGRRTRRHRRCSG